MLNLNILVNKLFFLMKLIYDVFMEIESRMDKQYIDYLFNTQFEKEKRIKYIKKFNLETLHLLFKNINYLFPDLVKASWSDIIAFKNNYTK